MKAAAFIIVALLIDGMQAALSLALAVVAAFPGTITGGVAGCWAGNAVAGQWGCAILGFFGGLIGTPLNIAAVATEPAGIALGFALDVCFSATLGAGLIVLLILNKMYYPKVMFPSGIVELMPGLDLFPGWTVMVVTCIWQDWKNKKEIANTSLNALSEEAPLPINSTFFQKRSVDGVQAPIAANDNNAQVSQRYAA